MVEPLRHRQTKGAVTDMFDLKPPRHTSTLPNSDITPGGQDSGNLRGPPNATQFAGCDPEA